MSLYLPVVWGGNVSGEAGNFTSQTGIAYPTNAIAFRGGPLNLSGPADGLVNDAAITYHGTMVLRDGKVWQVGGNDYGQLGAGSVLGRDIPVLNNLPLPAIAIANGGAGSHVVLEDGSVWSIGSSFFGELGNGAVTGEHPNLAWVQATLPEPVVTISASGGTIAALTSAGRIYLWGENKSGQCGTGTKTAAQAEPFLVPGLTGVRQVNVGGNGSLGAHVAAILADGTIKAWGSGRLGQIGDGTYGKTNEPKFSRSFGEEREQKLTPTAIAGISKVVLVACGFINTVLLKDDGTVWVCGCNDFGVCTGEDGIAVENPLKDKVTGEPRPDQHVIPTFRQVALPGAASWVGCGWNIAAAVVGGNLYCWGINATKLGLGGEINQQQLKKEETEGLPEPGTLVTVPTQAQIARVVKVAMSEYSGMALCEPDGGGQEPYLRTFPLSRGMLVEWRGSTATKWEVKWRKWQRPSLAEWEGHTTIAYKNACHYKIEGLEPGAAYEVMVSAGTAFAGGGVHQVVGISGR